MRRQVTWEEFERLAAAVADDLAAFDPDMVVGVARGGLPLAVALSHRLGCRPFAVAVARKSRSDESFDIDAASTFAMDATAFPSGTPQRVVVVDDVVACGDIFAGVEDEVRAAYGPDVDVRFATLFLDRTQVASGPYRSKLESCAFGEDIDNVEVWVVFPWEYQG
jgi:uncharacterized protein